MLKCYKRHYSYMQNNKDYLLLSLLLHLMSTFIQKKKISYNFIDSLRFIAIISIVLEHNYLWPEPKSLFMFMRIQSTFHYAGFQMRNNCVQYMYSFRDWR